MTKNNFKVIWSPQASIDLEEIILYIAERNPINVGAIFNQLKSKADGLSKFPYKGVVVPELKTFGITSYLQLIAKPWRIIYRIQEETVFVVTVIDSRQNVQEVLLAKIAR